MGSVRQLFRLSKAEKVKSDSDRKTTLQSAKPNGTGQLKCAVCRDVFNNDSQWEAHLLTSKHIQASTSTTTTSPDNPPHKKIKINASASLHLASDSISAPVSAASHKAPTMNSMPEPSSSKPILPVDFFQDENRPAIPVTPSTMPRNFFDNRKVEEKSMGSSAPNSGNFKTELEEFANLIQSDLDASIKIADVDDTQLWIGIQEEQIEIESNLQSRFDELKKKRLQHQAQTESDKFNNENFHVHVPAAPAETVDPVDVSEEFDDWRAQSLFWRADAEAKWFEIKKVVKSCARARRKSFLHFINWIVPSQIEVSATWTKTPWASHGL